MTMIAGQILNVFSNLEIESIIRILKLVPEQRSSDQSRDILNNGFTETDNVYPAIKRTVIQKINQVSPIKIARLFEGMHLIARDPYSVHVDFLSKRDEGYGYSFLIPLYTVPESVGKTSTVIFNEYSTTVNTLKEYVDTDPPKPMENAQNIWHLLPDTDPREYANYLSVKLIAHWHPGSLIYWDRRLLHSSDNFKLNNLKEKSALVLFTSPNEHYNY